MTDAPHNPDSNPLESLRSGIGRITHDMSTPLGIVRMALYALKSTDPDPARQARYVDIMSENLERVEEGLRKIRTTIHGDAGSPAPGRRS